MRESDRKEGEMEGRKDLKKEGEGKKRVERVRKEGEKGGRIQCTGL